MLQVVYDNDYVFVPLLKWGWPARWHDAGDANQSGWSNAKSSDGDADPKVFVTDGKAPAKAAGDERIEWLRYSHFVPSRQDWDLFEQDAPLDKAAAPIARPIGDFAAYDASNGEPTHQNNVDDLAVECTVDVGAASGKLVLECVKAGLPINVVFDQRLARQSWLSPNRKTPPSLKTHEGCISSAGSYRVEFANVDHQLTVWVNDTPLVFDQPTIFLSRASTSGRG